MASFKLFHGLMVFALTVLSVSLFVSCPKTEGGDEPQPPIVTDGGAGNGAAASDTTADTTDTATDGAAAGEASSETESNGDGDASTGETGESASNAEEEKKPAWKVEGVVEGSPLKLAAGIENEIILNFLLAKGTHFNDESPLSIVVSFVPEKAKIEPLEVSYAKPADIPKVISFKVTGLTDGMQGDLAFDIMAFFCSDEGYCTRRTDTITLDFEAAKLSKSAQYRVSYPLEME